MVPLLSECDLNSADLYILQEGLQKYYIHVAQSIPVDYIYVCVDSCVHACGCGCMLVHKALMK